MLTEKNIKNKHKNFVLNTYKKSGPVFFRGAGSFLFTMNNKKYLDLFPGWGVDILGHCHKEIVKVLSEQSKKLLHVPNNLYHPYQASLAEKIIDYSFKKGKVFFCNSGTEAVEAALKLAKAYGKGKRYEVISMNKSFHGRTLGSLSATAQGKYQDSFKPLIPGFKVAKFGDFNDLKKKITKKTVAVIIEPIQGEGGVNIASKSYLQNLRKFCSSKDILLIFDEIQTGMGRVGEMFFMNKYKITPDMFTLAKGLGAGVPIGALVVKEKFSKILTPGMHASTFGGSPIVTKVADKVFDVIVKEKILDNVKKNEIILKTRFKEFKKKFAFIQDVRGVGAMWAIELKVDGSIFVDEAFKRGLIINCTQSRVLRILPALNISQKVLNQGLDILEEIFNQHIFNG